MIDPQALHFAVSQSGETADTLSAVKEIQIKGGQVHGIVNVVGSTIARHVAKEYTFIQGLNKPLHQPKHFPIWLQPLPCLQYKSVVLVR